MDGLRAAGDVARRAADAPDGSGWAGCAALTAAAVNDSAGAAAALGKIAASEAELRTWGNVNAVMDGQAALRQSVFPWGNVSGSPAVAAALARIDAALARERAGAARILQGM